MANPAIQISQRMIDDIDDDDMTEDGAEANVLRLARELGNGKMPGIGEWLALEVLAAIGDLCRKKGFGRRKLPNGPEYRSWT